jgi:hypothetical protein
LFLWTGSSLIRQLQPTGAQSISSDQFFDRKDTKAGVAGATHNGYQRFDDDGEPTCCGCC